MSGLGPIPFTDADAIAANAGGAADGLGTYGLFRCSLGTEVTTGTIVAGSALLFASVSGGGTLSAGPATGSWQCMGHAGTSTSVATVYLRVA